MTDKYVISFFDGATCILTTEESLSFTTAIIVAKELHLKGATNITITTPWKEVVIWNTIKGL
ncbi:MAG TPA: hypothetical protein PLK61_04140 [Nitrosomonas sp.]|nr:hypothetical protein [Nitrosomonas sp.]